MLRRTTTTLLRSLRRSARTIVAAKSESKSLLWSPSPQVLAGDFHCGARSMALTLERPAPSVPAGEAEDGSASVTLVNPIVIFVLGGPGSGKGTQCTKIVEKYGFVHLSAGELLRAEINSGSENGTMIQNMIKEGKIVPSEVTVKLLQQAMKASGKDKFLIDGFPRNEENRAAFERVTGIEPEFILFFDCSEQEMEARLLGRNEGRVDDNIETIRKRFKVFHDSSLPVVDYYDSKGKVRKVNAAKTKDEVFVSIKPLFEPFMKKNQETVQHAHAA